MGEVLGAVGQRLFRAARGQARDRSRVCRAVTVLRDYRQSRRVEPRDILQDEQHGKFRVFRRELSGSESAKRMTQKGCLCQAQFREQVRKVLFKVYESAGG